LYAHCYYYDEDAGWTEYYSDSAAYFNGNYPEAVVVGAGRRLHIRLRKPERPSAFEIYASRAEGGQGRQLKHTFRRVERDGETVAWDVFFWVNQPDRHYYLDVYPVWERVPGTHIS
jgi:hypothetical protein